MLRCATPPRRPGAKPVRRFWRIYARAAQEVLGEQRDVLAALGQVGQLQAHHVMMR